MLTVFQNETILGGMGMNLDTSGAPPQAGESVDPQAGTSEGGQEPASPEDYKRVLADLRRENASSRKKLRDLEGAQAEARTAREAQEKADTERRGEFEKLYQTEKQAREQLAAQLAGERLDRILQKALHKLAPRDEALDDIMTLLDRKGLVVEDGAVDGLEERLIEFRKSRPYLFAEEAKTQPATGLPGYAPVRATPTSGATQADVKEAQRRGISLETWMGMQSTVSRAR